MVHPAKTVHCSTRLRAWLEQPAGSAPLVKERGRTCRMHHLAGLRPDPARVHGAYDSAAGVTPAQFPCVVPGTQCVVAVPEVVTVVWLPDDVVELVVPAAGVTAVGLAAACATAATVPPVAMLPASRNAHAYRRNMCSSFSAYRSRKSDTS